jgi:hypothetical protein
MIEVFHLSLGIAGSIYAMWLAYVLAIHIIVKWPTLPLASKILGAPPALLAYLFDILMNWTLMSALFFDGPRELTITERLHRYKSGWRHKVARWLCEHLINPFDAGHC